MVLLIIKFLALANVVQSEDLRKLAESEAKEEWEPEPCKIRGHRCTLMDDGYWMQDKDGNWAFYDYSRKMSFGKGGYEVRKKDGTWKFIAFEKREGEEG